MLGLDDDGNGESIPFNGFKKKPPVNHYYWTPSCQSWPDLPCQIAQFEGNFYGPYFAYLMRRHQLRNVYITNLVKCRFNNGGGEELIVEHCVKHFLIKEVEIFGPQMAFCFGEDAEKTFLNLAIPNCLPARLYHPSYIAKRWQLARGRLNLELDAPREKVQGKLIQMHDDCIQSYIHSFKGASEKPSANAKFGSSNGSKTLGSRASRLRKTLNAKATGPLTPSKPMGGFRPLLRNVLNTKVQSLAWLKASETEGVSSPPKHMLWITQTLRHRSRRSLNAFSDPLLNQLHIRDAT